MAKQKDTQQPKVEQIKIADLKQDEKNFNKGTEEGQRLVDKSFTELGAGRSVLVDRNGKLIAGNKSQKGALAGGLEDAIVIHTDGTKLVVVQRDDVDIDSEKGRKLALADNTTAVVGIAFDPEQLQQVAAQYDGFNIGEWGVDPKELGIADALPEENETEEDNFDEEKEDIPTICQLGDVWQLGQHRLMCGDSTSPTDVQTLMQGEQADLWLTDPPYNVDYSAKVEKMNEYMKSIGEYKLGGLDKAIENDTMSDAKFFAFLHDAFAASKDVLRAGGAYYVWTAQGHNQIIFSNALDSVGMPFKQQIIWNKNEAVLGRQDYQWKHEPCYYGWKEGAAHYFISRRDQKTVIPDFEEIDLNKMKKGEMKELLEKIYASQIEETIIKEGNAQRNHLHPTMKPVRLFGRLVTNSSKQGDIVLDTFGGSGTTIVACEQLARRARLMELDPHYCDVIIARWEKLTGQKAHKL